MNKTALITGSTSGIGSAYAEYYSEKGYNLILVSRTEEKLIKQKEKLINKYKQQVDYIVADLSKEYSAKSIFNIVKEMNVFVDVLINNVGVGFNGDIDKISLEKQHHEFFLNSLSVVDMCNLFIQPMREKKQGTIVNLGSTTAYYPVPQMAVYAASKSFVLSFTEALSAEVKKNGIKVLCVSPGPTDTNFFSSDRGIAYGKLRKPSDVVRTTIKGLKNKKTSVIDGRMNYLTSSFLPKILSRKQFLYVINHIMGNLTKN
ncbi:SDR family NAD(P)-dependent oxidoreductase [Mammaliicoccus sciuri]|uniref:SDR family NAD(P)-dependent oxidoreductase n=1 Tax=Mammaliicoccus sciuri TaxID=1296 RepID=UPI003F571163